MNKAEETIRTAYQEKIDAVIDYWDSQEYDPCNTQKKWRAVRILQDEMAEALKDLAQNLGQPSRVLKTFDDARERLLEMAVEARNAGDFKTEQRCLVEYLRSDRRPATAANSEQGAVYQTLVLNYINNAADSDGRLPLWEEVEAAITAVLPHAKKREKKQLLAALGFGLARDWSNGSAGALRLTPLAAQDGAGNEVE